MNGHMMRLFKSVRSITGSKESQASGRRRRKSVSWLLAGLVATGLGGTSGCSREYYRKSADEQADLLIHEKETDSRWMLPDRSIYMDPHSRYFDPNDPDHSPLPPDDPASHEFMHCLYGMKGSKKWHKNGELTELVNAGWKNYLSELMEKTEDGEYVLDLQDAVQLSLLQSPRFQTNVETLYLSALDVAFERFRFDTQFFAGNGTLWSHRANEFVHRNNQGLSIPGEPSSVLTTANAARATKLLPTGGQFMADFANTFVWQFAGTNENTRADSLLGFTFLQPLLRQGGREIALEQLTIAERALLANVRQMEWYRQGFLLDVAIGTGAGQGPQRRGGFLGGAGLSGFTGTGAGGFGGVGEASSFGRLGGAGGAGGGAGGAAGGGFAAGVAGNVSGFIGLVQQAQQIHNRQTNLQLQQENLARTSELAKAGRIESLQVDQFRQNVQSTRSQLLGFEYQFQTNVENFLISTMGLPPDVPVHIDESIVKPFQFTEPKLSELREHMRVFIERTRSMEDPSLDILGKLVDYFQQMRTSMIERFDVVRQDFQNLESVEQQRLESLHSEADRKEFLDEVARLTIDFTQLEKRFHATAQDILRPSQLLKTEKGEDVKQELVKQADSATEILRELALVQAGVRLEAVVLQPVNLDGEHAFHIAQANRLDIMNQRGEVVDQWRLITFNANRLESDLNVEFSGSFGTLDRNIVNFRDQTGSFSAAVRFDTPITRLGERNLYRQSLIDYQRVRREYIQFEDRVKRSLRNTLSGVILFDQEIELRRKALRIAIRVVDLSEEKLKAPPKPGAPPSETAVRDLLAALSDLLSTQDSIMNTYLNYQQLRMTLYRDLGVIRFDDRGMWIDEPLEAVLERLGPAPFVPPPLPPTENLQAAGGSEESSDVVTVAAEQVDDQIALASKTNPPGESSETEVEAAEAAQPLPVAVLRPEKKSIAPFPKRAWGRALPFLAHRPNNESTP